MEHKIISEAQFFEMAEGMKVWVQFMSHKRIKSKKDLDFSLLYADKIFIFSAAPWFILTSGKKSYLSEAKIKKGSKCARCSLLSEFPQGAELTILIGDPYSLEVTVEGIVYVKGAYYLCFKTKVGNILLALIVGGDTINFTEVIK